MSELTAEAIARVDSADLLADVLMLPEQVEDALWRVDSSGVRATVEGLELAGPIFVCGMGGSAIGGDLAVDVLGAQLTRPLHTIREYALPVWATPDSLVLCISYSGDTEETLACFDAAGALGASRVVVTAGGKLAELARSESVPVVPLPGVLQPRAAVAYMLVSVLELVAYAGAAPQMRTDLDAASSHLHSLAGEWGPGSQHDSIAKQLAVDIKGTVTCIYGAGPTASTAKRWKTQINENSKLPAFAAELPEADHNELVGWAGAPSEGKFSAIFLEDSDQHPRLRTRIDLTAAAIEEHATAMARLTSRGTNRVERVLSLVLLGDLLSLYLAVLNGVDPTPVEAIDRLKRNLERSAAG